MSFHGVFHCRIYIGQGGSAVIIKSLDGKDCGPAAGCGKNHFRHPGPVAVPVAVRIIRQIDRYRSQVIDPGIDQRHQPAAFCFVHGQTFLRILQHPVRWWK